MQFESRNRKSNRFLIVIGFLFSYLLTAFVLNFAFHRLHPGYSLPVLSLGLIIAILAGVGALLRRWLS